MTRQIPQEDSLKFFLDPLTGKVFDSLSVPASKTGLLPITQGDARILRKQTHRRRIAWAKKVQARTTAAAPIPPKENPTPESRDPQ